LFLTSRQFRAPDTHHLVELLLGNDLQLRIALLLSPVTLLFLLLQHPILYRDLVLQELNLLVPLREHGLVHLDYLRLRKAQYILFIHYCRLHFFYWFFVWLVSITINELRFGFHYLKIIVTDALLVVLRLLLLIIHLRLLLFAVLRLIIVDVVMVVIVAFVVKLVKKT